MICHITVTDLDGTLVEEGYAVLWPGQPTSLIIKHLETSSDDDEGFGMCETLEDAQELEREVLYDNPRG